MFPCDSANRRTRLRDPASWLTLVIEISSHNLFFTLKLSVVHGSFCSNSEVESYQQQFNSDREGDLQSQFKFQVGSVFDLDYLASLHGIASLRGKVDDQLQLVPRTTGKRSAVDRKIKVKEKDESEEEEEDGYGEDLHVAST